MKIIISRTDNIGDVILTLPLCAILKKHISNCQIDFLARDYVKPVIDANPFVDHFISWNALQEKPLKEIASTLKGYDTILHVFPQKKIAFAARLANIKRRIGTSHRWYHFLACNSLIHLSRKGTVHHEAILNTRLLQPFNISQSFESTEELLPYISLKPNSSLPENILKQLKNSSFNLILHPGSNGNTREWPSDFFRKLIMELSQEKISMFLTGSDEEATRFKALIHQTKDVAINLMGNLSLSELITLIAKCDGVLANSTGPLHIAASMGTNTLGLFPPAGTMSPLRWKPIGKNASILVGKNACNGCLISSPCLCMQAISVDQVKQHIYQWIKQR